MTPPAEDRMTLRLPLADSAALDLAVAAAKLAGQPRCSKTGIIRSLVAGLIDGRYTVPELEGIDLAKLVRQAQRARREK